MANNIYFLLVWQATRSKRKTENLLHMQHRARFSRCSETAFISIDNVSKETKAGKKINIKEQTRMDRSVCSVHAVNI